MQAPLRLLRAARLDTSPGLLLATAVSTAVFIATPISLSSIAERFAVGPGTAGLFSAAQLGAFVLASWTAGRFMRPSAASFRLGLVTLAAANCASTLDSGFVLFVVLRGLSGFALGVITWLAWSQVFGDDERQGDIAVVGPIAGVIVSPVFGLLLESGGDRAVFGALGVAALVPLLLTPTFSDAPEEERSSRSRAVPQAMALIAALTLLTLGGSAVFVFAGVTLIQEVGMSPGMLSLVFSANALASIPSARWRGPRPFAGLWLVVAALCAVSIGFVSEPWMAWPVLSVWGFAFWAGVPGLYSLLADRSASPAERAGDAQAAMAVGRAMGPLLGGAIVSAASFATLGIAGGVLMASGGAVALAVELRRPKN
jgi:predicted MFS family arabinose efflux permease